MIKEENNSDSKDEIIQIIGKRGCGKTTFVQSLLKKILYDTLLVFSPFNRDLNYSNAIICRTYEDLKEKLYSFIQKGICTVIFEDDYIFYAYPHENFINIYSMLPSSNHHLHLFIISQQRVNREFLMLTNNIYKYTGHKYNFTNIELKDKFICL